MAQRALQPSYNTGELSPKLFARVDIDKYHSGAALARNWFVEYQGGLSTRPGTQFAHQCKVNSPGRPRLIPFVVSTIAAYILEFGDFYVRFISDAAPIYEPSEPVVAVTNANPGVFTVTAHGYSPGDEVRLNSMGGMPELNSKSFLLATTTTDTFTLTDMYGVAVDTTFLGTYTGSGTVERVYTLASPYAVEDLPLLKFTQSANVLTLTHPAYPIYNLRRLTATQFALDRDIIGPTIDPPVAVALAVNGLDAKSRYGYEVTSLDANGQESLPCSPTFIDNSILNQTTQTYNIIKWDTVPGAASYKIYKSGPTASGAVSTATPVSTAYGYIGQSVTTSFVDNNIAQDFSQAPPTFQDPFSPGQLASLAVTNIGSGYSGPDVALVFTGDGTDAAGYAIVETNSGTIYGVVITNPGKGYTTMSVSDTGANTATYAPTLGQQTGTYPAAVTYFQQRRVFGGTDNFPETLVFSQPGSYDNFDTTPLALPTDSITASIASQQVNAIKAMIAAPTGLIVLTTGKGFLVSGGTQSSAITPNDVSALPQASSGCNDLPPLVINYDILYCQNRGAVVRDLAFNFYVQSYSGTDRSVLASHLFFGYELEEWTYSEEPFRLVQVVRNDGVLLNFTYVPEQEIFAWTHGDTNGFFRSIASIPEGQVNATYVIVERYVQGAWRYYIERFDARSFQYVEDSWCVDCGLAAPLTYPSAQVQLSAPRGVGVNLSSPTAVFAPGDVGKTLWAYGGQATVSAYTSSTLVQVDIISAFPTVTDDPTSTPVPLRVGDWSLDAPYTVVSGLEHLNGLQVTAVGDGLVNSPKIVTNGSIPLDNPATKITVGLTFVAQMQTLKLDLGDPTVQGKRKLIPALTARVYNTLGLSTGRTFATLVDMKDLISPYPPRLISNDARTLIDGQWNKDGQVCFQQSYPLPATILGVIIEEVQGDTQR